MFGRWGFSYLGCRRFYEDALAQSASLSRRQYGQRRFMPKRDGPTGPFIPWWVVR